MTDEAQLNAMARLLGLRMVNTDEGAAVRAAVQYILWLRDEVQRERTAHAETRRELDLLRRGKR